MDIIFDKLFRYDRNNEHCEIAIPVKKGELFTADSVQIFDNDVALPIQKYVTSRYEDGSIKYLFLRFLANLPGNGAKRYTCNLFANAESDFEGIEIIKMDTGFVVDTKGLKFRVSNNSGNMFDYVNIGDKTYTSNQFRGPFLKNEDEEYGVFFNEWSIVERGPLVTILKADCKCVGSKPVTFETRITAYALKPWIEVSVRIINSTDDDLHLQSFVFAIMDNDESIYNPALNVEAKSNKEDSTGCGDVTEGNDDNMGPLFITGGVRELDMINDRITKGNVRTCVAHSNYKTTFTIGDNIDVCDTVSAKFLVSEANEHFAEVFYGTFFADRTDENGGVCATVFQAQQNYPKAVKASKDGIYVMLVPEGIDRVCMLSGMSREQKMLLHFHSADESLANIDNRSLIYQMPDKPYIMPEEFEKAQVMPDIFVPVEKISPAVEMSLVGKADGHARCYGMLNFGDAPDQGYTDQGRGNGRLVWTNNEYDYPHAMYLMYARTGTRRFLDYANVAASHWMDVDVCHYSKDPLRVGGQWEHTMGHCGGGIMVCSHEWVEGLLDCYHFTGNKRAYETAIGIGENVLRLLDTPMYQKSGEINARETGWALRTLIALYNETYEDRWIAKCEWIVGHFREWKEEYGGWIAPYTDNTTIRVGFMISVAVGSLMRYYRVFPSEEIKKMIIEAVDDLCEECYMNTGIFYYKELPSLSRNGNNTLLLEALTIAYELTGDSKYLDYGIMTFEMNIKAPAPGPVGKKIIVEDTVRVGTAGTKNFAQSFIPLSVFYKALVDTDKITI